MSLHVWFYYRLLILRSYLRAALYIVGIAISHCGEDVLSLLYRRLWFLGITCTSL